MENVDLELVKWRNVGRFVALLFILIGIAAGCFDYYIGSSKLVFMYVVIGYMVVFSIIFQVSYVLAYRKLMLDNNYPKFKIDPDYSFFVTVFFLFFLIGNVLLFALMIKFRINYYIFAGIILLSLKPFGYIYGKKTANSKIDRYNTDKLNGYNTLEAMKSNSDNNFCGPYAQIAFEKNKNIQTKFYNFLYLYFLVSLLIAGSFVYYLWGNRELLKIIFIIYFMLLFAYVTAWAVYSYYKGYHFTLNITGNSGYYKKTSLVRYSVFATSLCLAYCFLVWWLVINTDFGWLVVVFANLAMITQGDAFRMGMEAAEKYVSGLS